MGLLSTESGGDADGFINGVDVSSTGLKVPGIVFVTGSNNNYIGSTTLGALLQKAALGQDVADGGDGFVFRLDHPVGSAVSLTFTAGSNDFAEFRGRIYVPYIEIVNV